MVFGGATAGAAASVFGYNRENFLEDREQRMKMEFALRRFRVTQAQLYREDVRCFVSLTERKMSIYLLVNVLMLGFTINLWCEGRLPETTPGWLVMGNQIAIAGSFAFLLLTVWLAVHAAIAAQSYQARILTQLVRLPVPSWQELEACRTYASDFEKLGKRQLFRVPFLSGWQEKHVEPAVEKEKISDPEPACAADPWGLERDGSDTVELGCHTGAAVAGLRHIKLLRQAAVYWQTYDAFARVSMSLGVCQLMLAMSYYMLGYVLTQARAPVPAFAGVAVLMGTAEVVARIDLTLPIGEQRLVQALMLFGPMISCISTYLWAQHKNLPARIAESLTPVAFLSHGAVVILLTIVLRVREQENGAMLPLAYQGVLYLDVFGWVAHQKSGKAAPKEVPAVGGKAPAQKQWRWPFKKEKSYSFAADYPEEDAERSERPASACIGPEPTRPEDQKQFPDDWGHLPGAPRMADEVNAVEPPAKEFWDAATFMPADCRERQAVDEVLMDIPGYAGKLGVRRDDAALETGHDDEAPGVLPWRVVRMAAVITSFVWIAAGFYCLLQVVHIWRQHLPWWWEIPALEGAVDAKDWHGPPPDLPWQPHRLALAEQPRDLEHLLVSYPYASLRPRALACSPGGKTFLVTDGLSLFSARPVHGVQTVFQQLPSCAAIKGEALGDVALLGSRALLLHRRGRRLASCPLAGGDGRSLLLSRTWLRPGEAISSLLTEPFCTSAEAGLASGCVWVGTTDGRAVRLRASGDGRRMVPTEEDELEEEPGVLRFAKNAELARLEKGGQGLRLGRHGSLQLELPEAETPSSFCLGGQHAFYLGAGPGAGLWRRPLPAAASLSSTAAQGG